jgi:hypothetical protein
MTDMIKAVESTMRLKSQSVTLSVPAGRKNTKPAFTEWAEKIAAADRLPRGNQFREIQRWRDFSTVNTSQAGTVSTLHILPE